MFKIVSLLIVLASSIFAVGESALLYMEIPVGARATSMGESFVSVADDPFTLMYNPAGLGQYPLNHGFSDIMVDSSTVMIDAVFKYDNNPEILMLLTTNGLIELHNGKAKDYSTVFLSPDETVDDVVEKWITDKTMLDQAIEEVVTLNNLGDIDYDETQIYELSLPYSIVSNEKFKNVDKSPDGSLFLASDTTIVIQSHNGWEELGYEKGLRGKIKDIDFVGNQMWVMTDKALFVLPNYKLIDQTTVFEPVTSKSLRTFWDKFNGFKFVADSTVWFKSKEYGILEYNLSNLENIEELKFKDKKNYNVAYFTNDSTLLAKGVESVNGHTITILDSLLYVEKVVDSSLIDSVVVDSLKTDTVVAVEKIDLATFDSVFVTLPELEAFIQKSDSAYSVELTDFTVNSYAKEFTSYGKVFTSDKKINTVSDIIVLDSLTLVLAEGMYYTKRGTDWKRFNMSNLKKGTFVGSNESEVFIQTSGELLKYNYIKNEWNIEIEKQAIAGAYSEKGFFLISDKDVTIYKKTGISFALDYQSLVPALDDNNDMFILSAPVIIPNIPIGALGVSINYASYGTSQRTDDNGQDIGTVHPIDLNIGAHWGVQVSNGHSVGIGFKGYYSKLADGNVGTQKAEPAVGWLGDLGYLYKTGIFNFGASIMNLGTKVVYVDDNQADPPPSLFHIGFSSELKSDDFKFMPTIDFSRSLWEDVTDPSEGIDEDDSRMKRELKAISPHGGFEFVYANLLALRAGYMYDAVGQRNYLPLGGGVKIHDISVFKDLNIDFSYIVSGFGDPFDTGGESVNEKTFKISIGSTLK